MIKAQNTVTGKYDALPVDIFSNSSYGVAIDVPSNTFVYDGEEYCLSTVRDTVLYGEAKKSCCYDAVEALADRIDLMIDETL